MEKGSGIERSEQSTLCNVSDTYLKANSNLNPMQTGWSNSNMKAYNFSNDNYYYLLFKEGFQEKETLMSYFLASRAIDLNDNYINFGIFEVSMGKEIQTTALFNSRGATLEYWDRIRPIVEIPVENITLDRNADGLTPETAWKI